MTSFEPGSAGQISVRVCVCLPAPLNFSEKRSRVYPVKPVCFLFNWDEFNRGALTTWYLVLTLAHPGEIR